MGGGFIRHLLHQMSCTCIVIHNLKHRYWDWKCARYNARQQNMANVCYYKFQPLAADEIALNLQLSTCHRCMQLDFYLANLMSGLTSKLFSQKTEAVFEYKRDIQVHNGLSTFWPNCVNTIVFLLVAHLSLYSNFEVLVVANGILTSYTNSETRGNFLFPHLNE